MFAEVNHEWLQLPVDSIRADVFFVSVAIDQEQRFTESGRPLAHGQRKVRDRHELIRAWRKPAVR